MKTGDHVEMTLTDRGPGFAPHLLPDPFARPVDGSRSRARGLGLPLASGLVNAMGGTVAARNRSEGGAEVVVRLRAG